MEVKTIITAVGIKAAGPENYRFTLASSANYQQTGGVVMQNKAASRPVGPGTVLVTSPTFYHPTNSDVEPWGQYSAVTIDPLFTNNAWARE